MIPEQLSVSVDSNEEALEVVKKIVDSDVIGNFNAYLSDIQEGKLLFDKKVKWVVTRFRSSIDPNYNPDDPNDYNDLNMYLSANDDTDTSDSIECTHEEFVYGNIESPIKKRIKLTF